MEKELAKKVLKLESKIAHLENIVNSYMRLKEKAQADKDAEISYNLSNRWPRINNN